MLLDLVLSRKEEAERLRTAVYRFAEMKARGEAPPVEVRAEAGRVTGAVAFWSQEAAREFDGFWRSFRGEPQSWHGFRDV